MRTGFPRSLLLLRSEPPIAQRPRRIYALAGLYFRTTPVISQPPFIFIFPPSLLTILPLAEPVMSPMAHVPSPLTPLLARPNHRMGAFNLILLFFIGCSPSRGVSQPSFFFFISRHRALGRRVDDDIRPAPSRFTGDHEAASGAVRAPIF